MNPSGCNPHHQVVKGLLAVFLGVQAVAAQSTSDLAPRIAAKQLEWAARGTLGFAYSFRGVDKAGGATSPRVEVCTVTPGGPAEAAGVRVGDQLLVIGGLTVDPANPPEVLHRFERILVGERIAVRLARGDVLHAVEITAVEPGPEVRESWVHSWIYSELGAKALADYRGYPRHLVEMSETATIAAPVASPPAP